MSDKSDSLSLIEDELTKTKALTPRQEKFLQVLFEEAGGDFRSAMDLAGYSKTTALSEVTEPLRDYIISASKDYLALNTPRAVVELLSVFNDPARPGNGNVIKAVQEVLDRGGVLKATEVQHTTETRNVFILPPKDSEPIEEKIIEHDIREVNPRNPRGEVAEEDED